MAASHLKVAVVTGSNKGIGLEIVKGLARTFKGVIYLTGIRKYSFLQVSFTLKL